VAYVNGSLVKLEGASLKYISSGLLFFLIKLERVLDDWYPS
jgi:hypothetical protein